MDTSILRSEGNTGKGPSQTTVLITGATSGIGRATADILARDGYRLVLCGRREERLTDLKLKLGKRAEVHTLAFDVADREAVFMAIGSLPNVFADIDVLINNAGNAHGLGPIQEGDPMDWDAMFDSNVKGLLNVSKAVLPGMVARRRGHVINIGSIAGKQVYANGSVYCASKFAVDALTQGMRIDLNAHGIKVGAIDPGAVETEFSEVRFKGDAQRAKEVYRGFEPLLPGDIAEIIHFAITRPSRVNIADLLVLPTAQASASLIHRKTDPL